MGSEIEEIRVEYIGLNALHDGNHVGGEPAEVRLRLAARARSREGAEDVKSLCLQLYWGPAGGGAMSGDVRRALRTVDVFLPRDLIKLEVEVVTS